MSGRVGFCVADCENGRVCVHEGDTVPLGGNDRCEGPYEPGKIIRTLERENGVDGQQK